MSNVLIELITFQTPPINYNSSIDEITFWFNHSLDSSTFYILDASVYNKSTITPDSNYTTKSNPTTLIKLLIDIDENVIDFSDTQSLITATKSALQDKQIECIEYFAIDGLTSVSQVFCLATLDSRSKDIERYFRHSIK